MVDQIADLDLEKVEALLKVLLIDIFNYIINNYCNFCQCTLFFLKKEQFFFKIKTSQTL